MILMLRVHFPKDAGRQWPDLAPYRRWNTSCGHKRYILVAADARSALPRDAVLASVSEQAKSVPNSS